MLRKATPERLSGFSDGVFTVVALQWPVAGLAICITWLLLYLRPEPAMRKKSPQPPNLRLS